MDPTEPHPFITRLETLARDKKRAELAALRQGLRRPPGETIAMFPIVVPYLPREPRQRTNHAYFLIASLFAAHPKPWHDSGARKHNLGTSFRRLRDEPNASASTDLRFVALLNATREDLHVHLRHAVSLLRAHDVPVAWQQLLRDIEWWDRDDRRVQREWAREFWRAERLDDTDDDSPSG